MATIYTAEEVAKHDIKSDLWVSIHGKVYDLTPYVEDHPGGVPSLLEVAGQNATVAFEEVNHTQDAVDYMGKFVIGELDYDEEEDTPPKVARKLKPSQEPLNHLFSASAVKNILYVVTIIVIMVVDFIVMHRLSQLATAKHWPLLGSIATILPWVISTFLTSQVVTRILRQMFPQHKEPPPRPAHFKLKSTIAPKSVASQTVLDPRRYVDLPIKAIEELSSNSNKIVVELPSEAPVLGLPIGQHISIRSEIDGSPVNRQYTPTSSDKDLGSLELVIKNYDTGIFTGKYLNDVEVGDKLSICGPKGQMRYRRGLARNIGMIAGGTGITPMIQIIRAICEDKWDDTKVTLLYANRAESDILLKPELDAFVSEHGDQLEVHYLLSQPSAQWTGGVGRITQELVQKSFVAPFEKENKVLICGPQGLVDDSSEWLVDLGYEQPRAVSKMTDQVFIF